MKKTYINPELVVVELQITQQIMTSSPGVGGQFNGGTPEAPELYWDEEMDEFEEY